VTGFECVRQPSGSRAEEFPNFTGRNVWRSKQIPRFDSTEADVTDFHKDICDSMLFTDQIFLPLNFCDQQFTCTQPFKMFYFVISDTTDLLHMCA